MPTDRSLPVYEALQTLIPELAESEDERIRKDIMEAVENWHPYERVEEIRAYLEKQKERQDNPNAHEGSWSGFNTISSQGKDTNIETIAQQYVENTKVCNDIPTWDLIHTAVIFGYQQSEKQKEQKPAEWSEEDEKIAYTILNLLCSQVTYVTGQGTTSGKQFPTYANERDWFERRFKSLRPQPHWKPSEEQMDALLWCTAHLGGADRRVLAELYEHLKKL